MIHFEGKRDRVGLFADLIVTDFGDEPRIVERPNVTIGARSDLETFSDSWSFAIWGDVAGGGTELTWSAAAVFGYHFDTDDRYGLRFGYRHLQIELDEGDRLAEVETEVAMTGPVVGFSFTF